MVAKKKVKTSLKKKKTTISQKKSPRKKKVAVTGKLSVKAKKTSKLKKKTKAKVRSSTAKTAVKKRPVTKKKIMDDQEAKKGRLASLRKILLKRREIIVKEVEQEISRFMSGEKRQLVDTAFDEGDLAVVDISEDVSLRMLATNREALYGIDEAIRKIDEGSYGICEECEEEISEKRLSILPTATLCIDCQEDKERLQAIEK